MTQFDLEQQIMNCWHVVDDLKLVREAVSDDRLSKDELENVLLGLVQLYDLKFEQTFDTFETFTWEHYHGKQDNHSGSN